jgi:adenosine deaminase
VGAEGSDFKFVKHPSLKFFYAFVCVAVAAFPAGGQNSSRTSVSKPSGAPAAEERAAKYLASVREKPLELMGFLDRMPKGGDLHNHLTGAVYAESYINYAVEDGDCIDRATFKILPPPCDAARGLLPASQAISDFVFRNLVIDALSIRNFHPTAEDRDVRLHFFATFGKFDLVTNKHWGEMLAEVTHRAGAQNEVYLETMLTPDQGEATQLGKQVGWNDDFAAMRSQLLAGGMAKVVADGRKNLDAAEVKMRQVLGCDGAQPDVGCGVTLRHLNQVLRAFPKEQVFAQMVAGFEIASADPRVVGINLVQSQDEFNALNDFDLQMRMLDYLHGVYPKVHITLHAGELTPGEVKPEELYASHIRKSIEVGHAERIGHGLDVIYEQDPVGLVALMARKHILVEDCLYSHELVRDMKGSENVLPTYLRGGVPVSLATDDEAIVRSELTWYFRRAVEGYNVDYHRLKRMVRDSLEHAFLAGASLWVAPEDFTMVAACANEKLSDKPAGASCREFLAGSEKARLQWKEENEFARFESKF